MRTALESSESRRLLRQLFVQHGRAYHGASKVIRSNYIEEPHRKLFLDAKFIAVTGDHFHLTGLGKTVGYGLLEADNIKKRLKDMQVFFPDIPVTPAERFAGKTVVDIGCGTGGYAALARRKGSPIAIGIDIQKPLLQVASLLHGNDGALFILGSSDHLPISSGIADIVILRGVLAYIDNQMLFEEISRIGKPNCQLWITTQGPGYFFSALLGAVKSCHFLRALYLMVVLFNGCCFCFCSKRIPFRIKKYFSKELISVFHTRQRLERLLNTNGYAMRSCRVAKKYGLHAHFFVSGKRL